LKGLVVLPRIIALIFVGHAFKDAGPTGAAAGVPKGHPTEGAGTTTAPTTGRRASRQKGANQAKANGEARQSKTASVLALLQRDGGVPIDEIMAATGWQRHSVRGFLSTLGSKGIIRSPVPGAKPVPACTAPQSSAGSVFGSVATGITAGGFSVHGASGPPGA
jgi:hypothetical protein